MLCEDCLTDKLPVHHVTVLSSEDILVDHSSDGKHGKTSVAELLVLVLHPTFITVVNPVGSSKKITGFVSWSLFNLLGQPLNSTTSKNELNPSNSGKLNHSLKRIVGKSTVKRGVDSTGVEVPSEASSHGNTAVLEFCLTVVFHGGFILTLGKTQRIKESCRGDRSNLVVDPGVDLGGGPSGLNGGKGGSRCNKRGNNSGLHGG
mmetsp:Transcript_4500/g.7387  ORF Transcript_4500/g.7387 Transcript_4500/m.7387 type:complete len:204 (-) Transcript_4500:62-673(-)